MWHASDERPDTVYDAEEALAMDRWLIDERGFTLEALMEAAGSGLAAAVAEVCRDEGLERVVWLVGPGHNGGDALVARRLLGGPLEHVVWRALTDPEVPDLGGATLVVDGLFGVGLDRDIEGAAAEALRAVAGSGQPVLAVDVPSGVHATTGQVLGAALPATWTVTFVGPKAGFFADEGPSHIGRWKAVEIGFPAAEAEAWVRARRAGAS